MAWPVLVVHGSMADLYRQLCSAQRARPDRPTADSLTTDIRTHSSAGLRAAFVAAMHAASSPHTVHPWQTLRRAEPEGAAQCSSPLLLTHRQ